ncbi:MAG: FAD-binding oxidoreductase [Clostridiales Family XIII bacterium]|jgi:D-lactate dehydrogenase (cytochrome)|nr:FAD-binding oxidoreductase [Clostridiales Family XIII bacterium]
MGGERIRRMSEEYEPYLRDESRVVGYAESISFPRTEVALRYALTTECAQGGRVTVQGGRTGVSGGAVPNGGHVLNLSRMDGITGMRRDASGAFHVRVQPGVVLSRLQSAVAAKRFDASEWGYASVSALEEFRAEGAYMFAPDPTEHSATIGGMAACNASGALAYRYGSMRRHISALRVMLCDGRSLSLRRGECRAKGRDMELRADDGTLLRFPLPTYRAPDIKNAAGYFVREGMDAVDLFIGSDGTLGVIFEIELALVKRPAEIWNAMCFFDGESEALRFVAECRGMVENLAAAEYFDGASLGILRAEAEGGAGRVRVPAMPARRGAAVCVELHSACENEAMEQLFYVGECLDRSGGGIYDTWVARASAVSAGLRELRHAIPESVNRLIAHRKQAEPAINKLAADMAVPDGFLHAALAMYRAATTESGLDCAIWGHIGNNHLHVNLLPRSREDCGKGRELLAEWARKVTEMGGTISAEHGVGKLKREALRIMYGERHILEMAALKRVFDPKGLLGAGTMLPAKTVGRAF